MGMIDFESGFGMIREIGSVIEIMREIKIDYKFGIDLRKGIE